MSKHNKTDCPSLINFILFRGILIWGGITGFLVTFWQVVFDNEPLQQTLRTSLIVYPVAGALVGVVLWWQTRKYGRQQ